MKELHDPSAESGIAVVSDDNYNTNKFDHVFSGYSIWLELETSDNLDKEMLYLQGSCGGQCCGVSQYAPHVTLSYNIPVDQLKFPKQSLIQFWTEFRESKQQQPNDDSLSLSAFDWLYFRYPKSADNGKGFGCSITLLLIEKSPWLQDLHTSCIEWFGKGERDNFTPHLSLVYAPEDKEDFLKTYTKDRRELKMFLNHSMPLKYLSLWSTEGRIHEWRPIAKIPLCNK
jgi:hypothetical protein